MAIDPEIMKRGFGTWRRRPVGPSEYIEQENGNLIKQSDLLEREKYYARTNAPFLFRDLLIQGAIGNALNLFIEYHPKKWQEIKPKFEELWARGLQSEAVSVVTKSATFEQA